MNWFQRLFGRVGAPAGASVSADIAAIFAGIDDLEGRLTAARAGYLDELDFGLQEAVAALNTLLSDGTYGLSALETLVDELETRLTAARAGYLDELDFDLQGTLSTIAGYIDAEVAAIITSQGRMLFPLDFWSDPVKEKIVTNAQVTAAVGAAVVVHDLPAGATVVIAKVMYKYRMVGNTNVAENSLDLTAIQPIQVDDSGNTGWLTCMNFVDEQFELAAETREGGDVLIGKPNVAARVDGNDTYD